MTEATHPGNGRRPDPADPTDPTERTTQLVDRAVDAFREVMETRLAGMDRATELVAAELKAFRTEADTLRERQQEATARQIAALAALLETRLGAMDKATELLAATVGRVPSDTDKQVNALRELLESRIDGMDEATKLLALNVREVPSDIDKANRALREVLQGDIRNVQDVAVEKFLAIDGTFASNALALTAALAAQKEAAAEQNKSNTLAITKSEQATKETIASNAQQTATSLKSLADRLDDLKERVDRGEGSNAGAADTRSDQRLNMGSVIAVVAVLIALVSLVLYVTKR
jgi:uncharacterized protein Yka (UPF0111/DUF47 family)